MKAYLFVCLALFCTQVLAVPVNDLYRSQVVVTSQTDSARNDAIKAAMAQTLVRITGSSDAASAPALADLLKDPSPFLLSYRYEQEKGELVLYAAFDQRPLEQAVWQRGWPVWGSDRPTTLLWIAAEQGGQRDLVSDASSPLLAKALAEEGKVRGLPVLLPLWDLDDKLKLDVLDVWGRFREPVSDASSRYKAEQFVIAKASQDGAGFRVSWQLEGALPASGDSRGDSLELALKAMVDDMADRLAQSLAVKGQLSAQLTQLTLVGVGRAADYLQALDELKALAQVADANVDSVSGSQVVFSLQLRGDEEQLRQALTLSRHFEVGPDGQYHFVSR
ncbi:DUF2066 domain-containing protein [Gallaecimonas xiamenensis]|uniref:DUF2066 domain-containing protein n=1 Tax=Gallaecimonas xiamenensis 3-C-1 TaxID=745411 RepID=K2K0E2_9GAMM|nr:DUF2066 domain-containing protein [Gallaecimonas xiamenensis]EKE76174.1 hypothetical protein B3C1_04680 [Gallaecimonas xiamenensis 3-C-1]